MTYDIIDMTDDIQTHRYDLAARSKPDCGRTISLDGETSMVFPYVSSITAGVLLLLQMTLAFAVSGGRGKANSWIGDGGSADLMRSARRHANLAENAGIFTVGFVLLELSALAPALLVVLSIAFVTVRLFHVVGLSRQNTNNVFRLIGGLGTYLIGFVLAGALVWAALTSRGMH